MKFFLYFIGAVVKKKNLWLVPHPKRGFFCVRIKGQFADVIIWRAFEFWLGLMVLWDHGILFFSSMHANMLWWWKQMGQLLRIFLDSFIVVTLECANEIKVGAWNVKKTTKRTSNVRFCN